MDADAAREVKEAQAAVHRERVRELEAEMADHEARVAARRRETLPATPLDANMDRLLRPQEKRRRRSRRRSRGR